MPTEATVTRARLQGLLDAVVALSSDLSWERLIERIVRHASEVTGARYAFLGILEDDSDKSRLSNFAVHGLDEEHQHRIGELPQGRGLRGYLIDHPEPLRIQQLDEHPASFGFPENHPSMSSFLGVPIRVHDRVFGNLYLTEKSKPGGFTSEDEGIAVAFASAAGVVIENARLYEQAERQRRWLQAAADITTSLLGPTSRHEALQFVADRTRTASSADLVMVLMPTSDGRHHVVEAVSGESDDSWLGRWFDLSGTVLQDVVRSRTWLSVDDTSIEPGYAEGWPDIEAGLSFPLPIDDQTGVLIYAWLKGNRPARWALDPVMPEQFAKQAALVLHVVKAQQDQARLAVLEDRDRIGRDLHDLVIQRLFAVGLSLDSTGSRIADVQASEQITRAVDELDATIKEIRRTIYALGQGGSTAVLSERVEKLVSQVVDAGVIHTRVDLSGLRPEAVPARVEQHLLAALGEALANAMRHSAASRLQVRIAADAEDGISISVRDDGTGFDPDVPRSGLDNMAWRAEQLGGRCTVTTRPGEGTVVDWYVPGEAG